MAEQVIYTLHRAVVIHAAAPVAGAKGVAGWAADFGETLNARTEFVVRDASDDEAKESAEKLEADVAERVKQLRFDADVKRRMAELRQQQGKG